MTSRTSRLLICLSAGVVMLLLHLPAALAEIRDALPPDTGVTSASLNSGGNTQQKTGSLIIGTGAGAGKFCLNATSSSDAQNCISDWSQISTKYVTLTSSMVANIDAHDDPYATLPENYFLQTGYSDINSGDRTQLLTAAVTSSDVNICVRNYNDQGPGNCFVQGILCFANSDCTSNGLGNFVGTAVYGATNGSATSYGGYFGGTVYVHAPSTSIFSGNDRGRICLGDIEPAYTQVSGAADGCISAWNELTSSLTLYVQRQSANPPISQTYGAAISGSSYFASAVVGSTAGLSLQATCGNGICDSGENTNTCPADCASSPTPTDFAPAPAATATLANLLIDLPITTAAQVPSPVKLLIVRSLSVPPSFQPTDGVNYAQGANLGNNTFVVVNTNVPSNSPIAGLSDTLPARGTYYYQAYQATTATLKYSAPTAAMNVTPYQMATTVSPVNKGVVSSNPPGITCTDNVNNCKKILNTGATIVLTIDSVAIGYQFSNWTGSCDQINGAECTVLMNADKNVGATFVKGGGGGGAGV